MQDLSHTTININSWVITLRLPLHILRFSVWPSSENLCGDSSYAGLSKGEYLFPLSGLATQPRLHQWTVGSCLKLIGYELPFNRRKQTGVHCDQQDHTWLTKWAAGHYASRGLAGSSWTPRLSASLRTAINCSGACTTGSSSKLPAKRLEPTVNWVAGMITTNC